MGKDSRILFTYIHCCFGSHHLPFHKLFSLRNHRFFRVLWVRICALGTLEPCPILLTLPTKVMLFCESQLLDRGTSSRSCPLPPDTHRPLGTTEFLPANFTYQWNSCYTNGKRIERKSKTVLLDLPMIKRTRSTIAVRSLCIILNPSHDNHILKKNKS